MANTPKMALLRELTPTMAAEVIRIRAAGRCAPGWGLRQVVTAFISGTRRIIVVGNTIYTLDPTVHAHEFLVQFQKDTLGIEWGRQELAKPYTEQHPTLQWHHDSAQYLTQQREALPKAVPRGIPIGIKPTGPMKSLYSCAFDLFTVANNNRLDSKLMHRLRIKDQFQGARYELFIRAFLLRSGFSIALEDESKRGRKNFELTATSSRTNESFSVEAKSRHRPGYLGHAGKRESYGRIKLDFGVLISEALAKHVRDRRIVFVDLNFPPTNPGQIVPIWYKQMDRIVRRKERQKQKDGSLLPPCYLVLTNHPYHYGGVAESAPTGNIIVTGFNIPRYRALGLKGQLTHHPVVGELITNARMGDLPDRFPVY